MDARKLLNKPDNSKVLSEIKEINKPKIDVNRLVKRRNKAKGDLDKWRSLLETAYHYSMPNYNPFENAGFAGKVSPGQQYNADIYDLTLPIAHKKLADKMLMGLVPQGMQWVKFKPGDDFGDPQSKEYREALQATQKMTDQFFNILNRSNFYTAVSESLNDVLISTGTLAVNEGTRKNPLKFEAVPASHVMFEGNAEGGIDAVFRDWHDVRVENIKSIWTDPKTKKPEGKDLDDKVNIWECAYIDHEADENERYKYVVMTTNKDVLLEQASPSWPWVVYRMRKMPGETRGRGPSLDAYPTAGTINEALGDELIAAAFTANPMYMASSDSALNQDTITVKPGAIIPVQMVMGQWPIQAFPGGGNIQFSSLLINDFRDQINQMMFAFPLGAVNSANQTATEAQIRYQENMESFAAMVPRLQAEFFTPIIERCMWIIKKILPETFAGIDESILDRMLSFDGQLLSLRYETPLMTAQGKIKSQNILGFYQELSSMIGPEGATATLNPPNLVTSLAENNGVDLDDIKTKEELEQQMNAIGNVTEQTLQQQGIETDGQ